MEYKELNKQFWGQHLWARGYFVASSGNVTDEIIKEYIQNQDLQEKTKTDNLVPPPHPSAFRVSSSHLPFSPVSEPP